MAMLISNTSVETSKPWPEGIFIQGGGGFSGLTAFVEVAPEGTFIRGEGATILEAEETAWNKYQKEYSCSGHEYEPRGYVNGVGVCSKCEHRKSKVFTGEELGQYCLVCAVGTTYACYTDEAFFDSEWGCVKDEGDKDTVKWYCQEHTLFKRELDANFEKISSASFSADALIQVLRSLSNEGVGVNDGSN